MPRKQLLAAEIKKQEKLFLRYYESLLQCLDFGLDFEKVDKAIKIFGKVFVRQVLAEKIESNLNQIPTLTKELKRLQKKIGKRKYVKRRKNKTK